MNKRMNRKGFTLAEVLIVVAIIVVLMSVGAIALVSHMRNMQKLEMDGQAKELFVAAQNHLSLAESQGYLGVAEFTGEGESATSTGNFGFADAEKGVYYIVVKNGSSIDAGGKADAVLKQMLPFGSMDESARAGGSYIIRYQKDPAQVLDVFYVSTSGRYKLKNGDELGFIQANYTEDLKGYISNPNSLDLKNYKDGAVVGYYGGAAPLSLTEGVTLLAPTVEIINGEQLIVKVTDHNGSTNSGTNMMTLVFTDSAGKELSIPLKKSATNNLGQANYARLNGSAVVEGDDTVFTLIIDDVTKQNLHFAYDNSTSGGVSDFAGKGFAIGEDITVYAVAYNNSVLTNIAQSVPQDFNSLFASLSGSMAKIGYFRHLLNLDATVSGIAATTVTAAVQIANLDWNSFTLGGITNSTGSDLTASGKFYPVTPATSSFEYDGKDLSIANLVVEVSTGEAGLFADFSSGTIKDLMLKDFTVKNTGSGNAGALAGSFGGTSISGVLAYNTADTTTVGISSASGSAGGLVGKMTAGTVDKSAAAVYVSATGGNAGGLIGLTDGAVTVSSSYSGGHTEDAKYRTLTTASPRTSFNVQSASGNVGGLIGLADGTSLTVNTSYSTASAKADAENTGAGGLIGNISATTATINNSYATGLVLTGDKAATGAFVALSTSTITGEGNKFLSSLNASPSNLDSLGYTLTAATSSDAAFCLPKTPTDTRASAVPYDTALITGFGGKYSFPTIDQLNGITDPEASLKPGITDRHYGDWQLPGMEILHYTLENKDALYTDITLKSTTEYVTLALYGETSGKATVYSLRLSSDQGSVSIVDKGTLTTSGTQTSIAWQGTSFVNAIPLPGAEVSGTDTKTLRVLLDDITAAKKHFASVFPELIPGENVTLLLAGGECTWDELNSLRTKTYPEDMEDKGQIIALSDNSIFAKTEALEDLEATKSYETEFPYVTALKNMSSAEIVNFRHLQNLDTSVSNVNASAEEKTAGKYIKTAKLMDNINLTTDDYDGISGFVEDSADPYKFNWTSKRIYLYDSAAEREAGKFNGIYNQYLAAFDGNDKTIVGLPIGDTKGSHASNAGLFRYVDSNLNIEHLRLADPTIEAGTGGVAGNFVAEVASGKTVTLRTVLAVGESSEVSAATAGGLVGKSSGTLKIVNSAASVYVTATSGAAGGLLGIQSGGTVEIQDSYVGGHTSGGEYTDNWNISGSTAAGGLIGETVSGSTAIRQSFNAASVYSGTAGKAGGIIGVASGSFSKGFSAVAKLADSSYPDSDNYDAIPADGKILNLVYVVAPVNSVSSIGYSGGAYSVTGGSGSVMGSVSASALAGSGLYFLPDVYTDPTPVLLGDGFSNINPIGKTAASLTEEELEAIQATAKVASTYEVEGGDNAILGVASGAAHLEQKTTVFDDDLSRFEYPFSIWTTFGFKDNAQLYYYGDWQRLPHVSNIHLVIHFVASLPGEGETRTNKSIEDEELILQIPYTPTKFDLLYAPDPSSDPDYYDYKFSDSIWSLYEGDGTKTTTLGSPITTYDRDDSGGRVALTTELFQRINDKTKYVTESGAEYKESDGDDPYLHITLVATYAKRDSTLHVLRFFDQNADGTYPTEPTSFLVVENESTADELALATLLAGKSAEVPTYAKTGKRLTGWYTSQNGAGNPVFTNVYSPKITTVAADGTESTNSGDNRFHLQLTVSEDAKIAKSVLNYDIYSNYQEIKQSTIHVRFYSNDTDNNKVPNVDDFDLTFEADRGFYSPIKLASGNGLSPVSVAYTDTPDAAVTDVTLQNSKLYFNIGASSTAAEISYTVTYQVTGLESTGYVILCEKLHTDDDGKYNAAQSQVVAYPYTNPAGGTFGATKPGEAPNPSYNAIPASYFADCGIVVNSEFVPYGMKILSKDDNDNFVDGSGAIVIAAGSEVADSIPDEVNAIPPEENEADDYEVTYVVLLQYSRQTYQLKIDTNGCKNKPIYYDPFVEFGTDVYTYLNSKGYYAVGTGNMERDNYAFSGWSYPGGTTGDVATDKPIMPAQDLTVTAQWLGAPAPFTVLFMTQTAENENEYTLSGYDNSAELKANAGTGFEFSGSGVLSWLNDANPADENVPPKSTKLYDEASIISYLDDDDPVKQIFQYFQLNVEKTISENKENGNPIKVRDDGNTTYKVYLDRKLYTLRFDVFFSEWTGASWGHKVLTDQYRDNKVINEFYGLVNGQYVLLNKDSQGNWTYSGKKTVDYNGPRYKETETNATPQYGIVQGDIVQLTTNVSYQTDGKRRYYLYTGKEHGKYFLVDDAGNNIGSDHHVTWNEAQKVWIRDSNNSITYKCVYTRDNSGTENQDYTGTVYFINADGSFSESGTGNAPYGKISDYYVKLKQKPGEVTWSYNGNRYTGTRYLRTETVTDQSYALGWLEETKELKALSYDASRQQWYYETDDANTTSQYGGTVYFKGVVGGSEQCYVSSITNAKQGGGYEGFLTTGRQSATKSLFSDYDYKAYDVEQGGKYYTVYYLDVTARYGENIYNEWPATYPKQGSYNFVGWIQNDQSKLCLEQYDETKPVGDNNRPSSLKGKYETMSETVLLVRWNGTDFSAKSVEEGIAQEFHCRYSNSIRTYVYRFRFQDADGNYNAKSTVGNINVNAGSGSVPSDQTPASFNGYKDGVAYVLQSANGTPKKLVKGDNDTDTYKTYTGGMIIEFRYDLSEWDLILHNAAWTSDEIQTFKNTQSLDNYIAGKTNNGNIGTNGTKTFAGWYTTPDGVAGSEFWLPGADNSSVTMPNSILNLYAVWRDAPKNVKFELSPQYKNGTQFVPIPYGASNLDWPNGRPDTDKFEFNNVPHGNTLLQQGIEWEKYEPELEGWDFRYWQTSQGQPFSVEQPIVQNLTLYPYFEKAQKKEATINISYVYGGAEPPANWVQHSVDVVTVTFGGDPFSWTPHVIDGFKVEPAVVPPTYMTEARLHEEPFSYDEEKDEYNLVFTYSEASPEWTYNVGYYLRLKPSAGGAAVEIPLLLEDTVRTATGDFKFEQFYAMPGNLSAYEFQSLEVWKSSTGGTDVHVDTYDTTDATLQLKRGDGNKIKVFLQLDPKAILPENQTTFYNGEEQGFTKEHLNLTNVYLPTGEGAITVNDPYCTYYSGATKLVDSDGADAAPKDAGLYGAEITITVTYRGTEYKFWESERVSAGKKPAVTYRINRCVVKLTSGSITNMLYRNTGNQNATIPSGCAVAPSGYVARDTDTPTVECTGDLVTRANFTFGFSADSFRRAPSQYGTFDKETGERITGTPEDPDSVEMRDDYTTNVFSYQVSGLDLNDFSNNFSIYKVYGKLYIWNSVADYNAWLADNPSSSG